MPTTHKIVIKNGTVSFIYNDKLAGLTSLGNTVVKRASHVEPHSVGGKIRWMADLSPVQPGVLLGPFDTRAEALAAEVQWLENHYIK